MQFKHITRIVVAAACLSLGAANYAQEKKPDPKADAEMAEWMKLNAPGPQHAALAKMAGEWDATVTMFLPDGGGKAESKATEKSELVLGGRFVQSVMTGTMVGMPFEGRGMIGYDTMRKKYVSTWADSMSTQVMVFEGTADEANKVITMTAEQTMPGNQVMKWRTVTTLVDDKTYTFEMFATEAGKKEVPVMAVKYVKK